MYGYLRLLNGENLPDIHRYYKSRYCSLCHAMWVYYGLRPRLLLSYDMTFLSIVLDLSDHVNLGSKLLCYKKAKIVADQEKWKRISALSILLAAMKFEDDIADDNDAKAKIARGIFGRAARKAENDYPELATSIKNGFRAMSKMEIENKSVFELAQAFGSTMMKAVALLFECAKEDFSVMRHVTEWVYFIDALDDLDKDTLDGSFNPFKSMSSTKDSLIKEHSSYVESFILKQMESIKSVLPHYSSGTYRDIIILSTLTDTIPTVTKRIMNGEKPYRTTSPLTQVLEMRGGYKLV